MVHLVRANEISVLDGIGEVVKYKYVEMGA